MEHFKLIVYFAATLMCFGCATAPGEKISSVDFDPNTKVMVYNAGIRSVLLNNKNGKLKICAEPAPDASISDMTSGGLNMSFAGQKEGVEESNGQAESSLGGRNGTVLLTREAFYRLCEMYLNSDMSTEQYMQFFVKVLNYSAKVGDEQQAKYETKVTTQNVELQQSQESSDSTDSTDPADPADPAEIPTDPTKIPIPSIP